MTFRQRANAYQLGAEVGAEGFTGFTPGDRIRFVDRLGHKHVGRFDGYHASRLVDGDPCCWCYSDKQTGCFLVALATVELL